MPPDTWVRVEDVPIRMGSQMSHLGLTLDGKWRFTVHFTRLAPRFDAVAAALGRLLSNLGGPDGRVRKLYGVQRKLALRAAWAYRTVAHTAAVALAGIPPAELLAQMYTDVYRCIRELREGTGPNTIIPSRVRQAVKRRAWRRLLEHWQLLQVSPGQPGHRVADAIGPPDWST
ncbi:uncharacterized protein [Anoplolepis gracilipes]|uniref:uncharacterized protein n=1 Tax=Anoplolepis gracilipes TaxID=354296 RepID=UPI003B9E1CE2